MNDISFQGPTNFSISPTAYNKVQDTTRKAYTNLKKQHNRSLSGHVTCTLDTDPDFLTVIVNNDNRKGLFRYIPLKPDIQDHIDDLSNQVKNLQKTSKGNTLTAWILGGMKLEGEKGDMVSRVLKQIADLICDKPNIDTSILVGSSSGEEKYILKTGFPDLRLALDKKINPKNSLESELNEIFDIVELNNTEVSYVK